MAESYPDWQHARQVLGKAARDAGLERREITATLDSAERKAREPSFGPQVPLTPPSRRQRLYSLDDLANLPEPKWLLDRRLPEGLTVLYGDPGLGKSFTALDWGLTLGTKGHKVLFFAGEGLSGLGIRTQAWLDAHRPANPKGYFYVYPAAPHLLDPTSRALTAELIAEVEPKLLIVDTLARSLVGGDENSARDVGEAIAWLDHLREEYGCSSLVIHHSGKIPGSRERGSSALRGAADCMWAIEAVPDLGVGSFTLKCVKPKDFDPPGEVLGQLRKHGPSAIVHPSAVEL